MNLATLGSGAFYAHLAMCYHVREKKYITPMKKITFALILLIGASVASITKADGFPQITLWGNFQNEANINLYGAGTADLQRFFSTSLSGSDYLRVMLTTPIGDIELSPCQIADSGVNIATTTTELGTYTDLRIENYASDNTCFTSPIETTSIFTNAGNGIFSIVAPSSTIVTSTIFVASTTIFYSFGQTLFYGIIIFLTAFVIFGIYLWKK